MLIKDFIEHIGTECDFVEIENGVAKYSKGGFSFSCDLSDWSINDLHIYAKASILDILGYPTKDEFLDEYSLDEYIERIDCWIF